MTRYEMGGRGSLIWTMSVEARNRDMLKASRLFIYV